LEYSGAAALQLPQTLTQSVLGAILKLISSLRTSSISRLNVKSHDILSDLTTLIVATKSWFLQLESCNSGSANPHGCVGRSGLHDICPTDDLAEVMTGRKLVSRENGRSVNQTVASSRIRRIGEEPGNLEINPDFGKLARVLENRPGKSRSESQNGTKVSWRLCRSTVWFSFPDDGVDLWHDWDTVTRAPHIPEPDQGI